MITAETIEKFIEQNRTSAVLQTLQSMSEEERLALKDTAIRTVEIFRFREVRFRPSRQFQLVGKQGIVVQEELGPAAAADWQRAVEWYESAKVIVLYCCDFQELKTAGQNGLPTPDNALKVLSQRKPDWLDKWCTITMRDWPAEYWRTVFELEKLCKRKLKHTLDYYQALALGLPSHDDMEKFIVDSPALKDEFYAFLASPTTIRAMAAPAAVLRDIQSGNIRKFASFSFPLSNDLEDQPERWIKCIKNLANQDKLDRGRLVEMSFQTLANAAETQKKRTASYMPGEPIAQFLCSLNDALCPDKSTYLRKYASLIGATNSDVSIYATNLLLGTTVTNIPVEDIISNIPMAFRNRDKAPAEAALKLLDKLAKLPNAQGEAIALAVIDSFSHKSKAVHREAVSMLAKGDYCKIDSVKEKLRNSLDLLEGINRSAASNLLTGEKPALAKAKVKDTASVKPANKEHPEAETALNLAPPKNPDQNLMKLAGIYNLCEASRSTFSSALATAALTPVNLASMDSPRLFADQKITPIETIEDLVYLVSASLSSYLSSHKLELMLDGIARLWKNRGSDFEERTRSLRTSLEQVNPLMRMSYGDTPMGLIARLWLAGDKADANKIWFNNTALVSRCRSLADRMRAGLALPMLAAPTHNGGWIEPVTLVRRVKAYQEHHRLAEKAGIPGLPKSIQLFAQVLAKPQGAFDNDESELIQALLRLAPEGRKAALEEASSIKGMAGRALRYSLGGGDITVIDKPAYAVAAFRSRTPRGICQSVTDSSVQHLPDVVYPAQYTFDSVEIVKFMNDHYRTISPRLPDFLSVKRNGQSAFPEENSYTPLGARGLNARAKINEELYEHRFFPTVLLHRNHMEYLLRDWSLDWVQNKEPLLARMSKTVLQNINSIGSDWQDNYSILFDPDFPLDENGSWLFSLALAAKHDDLRRSALDLLIAAVDENRADAGRMGKCIALLLEHKFTVLRWTKSLRELARVSPLHALFSWQLLLSLLAMVGIDCPVGFLELMLELKEEHGFGLSSEAIEVLKHFGGSGKAATLVKKLTADGVTWNRITPVHEAAKQSFASRIARVERWERSQYFVAGQS